MSVTADAQHVTGLVFRTCSCVARAVHQAQWPVRAADTVRSTSIVLARSHHRRPRLAHSRARTSLLTVGLLGQHPDV